MKLCSIQNYSSFRSAFTLVELIVVVTILSILGTIGFLSFQGYSRDAKNSTRIADMRTIDKALSLFSTSEGNVPLPDNAENISYSGGLAWIQGEFGETTIRELQRIADIPVDPVTGSRYGYSITNNRTKYQLGSINEGGFFSHNTSITPQTHALSSENTTALVLGNYIYYDVVVKNGSHCYIISTPSIMLSDIPVGNELIDGDIYNFVYRGSEHIPNSYSGSLEAIPATSGFQVTQAFNSCVMQDLIALDLYIAKVSTAYQSFASNPSYENLIFNSSTRDFRLTTIQALEEKGLTLSSELIQEFNNPVPEKRFTDTFSDTDGTNITASSGPISGNGSWTIASEGNSGAFVINNNALEKADESSSFLQINPLPAITEEDYSVSFDITNFAAGSISTFLRYIDSDNYYSLDVSSSGYQIMRRSSGTSVPLASISETINIGDTIHFEVDRNIVKFEINDIQKENIVASGVSGIGETRIFMQNSGASIDNYTLTYK